MRTVIAEWASIGGFVISFIVFVQLLFLKKSFLFAVRVPELVQRLAKQASEVSAHLSGFAGATNQIPVTLGLVQGTLKSLESKLPRGHRQSVSVLLDATKSYSVNTHGSDGLHEIYGAMVRVIQELEDLRKDREARP